MGSVAGQVGPTETVNWILLGTTGLKVFLVGLVPIEKSVVRRVGMRLGGVG